MSAKIGKLRLSALLLAAFAGVGPAVAEQQAIEVRIEKGAVVGGPEVFRVTQGDAVEIRWTSDAPVVLHLHGYDLEASAAPDAPGIMSFPARATGRFPIEAHAADGAHRTLFYLEVYPR